MIPTATAWIPFQGNDFGRPRKHINGPDPTLVSQPGGIFAEFPKPLSSSKNHHGGV